MRPSSQRAKAHHGVVSGWFVIVLIALFAAVSLVQTSPAHADERTPSERQLKRQQARKKATKDTAKNAASKKSPAKKAEKKKLNAKDAAFIIVKADFNNVRVTVNDKPYPTNSSVGAIVAPKTVYEVAVTDTRTNATARYKIKLKAGEARVIMASLASSGGSAPPPKAARKTTKEDTKTEEAKTNENPPEEGSGFLTVNSTPTAQVYIDGKLVASKTPLVKHSVSPGNHTVRVYYVDDKKFSETKRAMITDGRHVNLYFQNKK